MTVLIVDDHIMVRKGLKALLTTDPGFTVVGEADNGSEALRLVEELRPELVLTEVLMRDANGIDATRQIVVQYPQIKIVALTNCREREYAQAMFLAGASGYVLKSSESEELFDALQSVKAGRRYISPAIAEFFLDDYLGYLEESPKAEHSPLSAREREVLQLLAEGNTTKEIAQKLCITINTVDTHRKHISDKLGLRSIAELTKYAVLRGITALR